MIVDLHSDLLIDIADRRVAGERDVFRRRHLPALAAAGVRVQLLAAYVPTQHVTDLALRSALRLIEAAYRDAEESDGALAIVTDAASLDAALDAGAVAGILTLEGAEPLGREPELVRLFGRLGVRSIGLTWNRANDFADGTTEDRGAGITPAGRRLLHEMAEAGIALDLSHLTERGASDALEARAGARVRVALERRFCPPHPPQRVRRRAARPRRARRHLRLEPAAGAARSRPGRPAGGGPLRPHRRGRRRDAAGDRRRLRRVPAARAGRAAPPAAAGGA